MKTSIQTYNRASAIRKALTLLMLLAIATSLSAQRPRRGSTSTRQRSSVPTPQQKKPTKAQLQQQQAQMAQQRRREQQRAAELNRSIRTSLDSVLILDNQIGRQQRSIDSLTRDINALRVQIDSMTVQLEQLKKELADKKSKYGKAMVYMQRSKTVQEKLMFVFSASNLEQMIRRARYIREYSTFQRAQGQIIKQQQAEVHRKQNELLDAKTKLETHRVALEETRKLLERDKGNCQKKVDFLNQNLATVQQQIKEYQRKEAELNAQIDRIIQEEIAEARRRAEAERRRREEEARKRAEEERLAAANAKKKGSSKAPARPAAPAAATPSAWEAEDAADRKLSSSFTANKGRLPMPITGSYSIVGRYGTYTVAGLRNVTLDNKGIDIRGQQGAQARSVFDGTVSSVFQYGGQYIVMVRHGSYISVYSGLSSVIVKKGAKVSTKQALGNVGTDENGNYVLHFQLRQESSRLNPQLWVR